MHLIIKAPFDGDENVTRGFEQDNLSFDNEGNAPLSKLLGEHGERVKIAYINGKILEDWKGFVGGDDDVVEVVLGAGPQAIPMIIIMVIQILMSILMQVLAPKPKKRSGNAAQPAFGIAGVTNTIAPGTTKLRVYGIREVFGHIIASTVTLTTEKTAGLFTRMAFSVIYFMGSGPIKNIVNPKLTGTDIADIPGAAYNIRLGYDDQEIFSGHENVNQVYSDGRSLGIPTKEDTSIKDPIIYTTRGVVDKATLIISFPNGIFGTSSTGDRRAGWYDFEVKYKLNGSEVWVIFDEFHYFAQTQDGCFGEIIIEFPENGKYDVSLQVTRTRVGSQDSGAPILFNVMETQYIHTTYPGSSMLEITGVDSAQINSLEALETSATVHGAIIPVWDADCQLFVNNWTQSRAFIIRDIMTNVKYGMGASFPERLIDDGSLIDAMLHYEMDQVTGYDGLEDRDHCDVLINESKPGQDWIKNLCYEGDSRLIPSRGRFKYIIDRGESLEMRTYGEPDGVVEGSINVEFGRNDRPVNVITAEFADETQKYKMIPCRLEKLGGLNGEEEIQEQASYTSITRPSQVERRMRRDVNALNLIEEFYDWKAPKHALVNEVWDAIFLSFKTIDFLKGYSGFVGPDTTTTVINLNQEVTLLPDLIYHIYIKGLKVKGIIERVVSTAAGKRTSVTTTAAITLGDLGVRVGDVWVLGVPDTHISKLKIEEVKRDKDGTYDIKGSLINPLVYQIDDPLLEITDGINTVAREVNAFQPIIAQVVGVGGNAEFRVATGFDHYRGTSINTGTTFIDLEAKEPNVDDFFIGYGVEIGGVGLKVIITDYDGGSRRAFFNVIPEQISGPLPYRLSAPDPARFAGYSVEVSPTAVGPFVALASTPNTILSVAGYGSSTDFFRITPVSSRGVMNLVGRWVIQLSAGDTIAPPAPDSVVLSQVQDRNVQIVAVVSFPLPRDVWKLHLQLGLDAADGTTLGSTEVDISDLRNEDNASGTKNVSTFLDMSAQPNGVLVFGRAWIEDFFGNVSAVVSSELGVEISTDENADDLLISETNVGDVTVTNTTVETPVSSMVIPGGGLGTNGLVILETFMRVTDNDPFHNATLTLRAKFKGEAIVAMECRTSDLVSCIDTDNVWRIQCYLIVKNQVDRLLVYLVKEGDETLTDAPYPGDPIRIDRGTNGVLNVATTGLFTLTVQWSMASSGLSLTKEVSRQEFFPHGTSASPADGFPFEVPEPVIPPDPEDFPGTPQE